MGIENPPAVHRQRDPRVDQLPPQQRKIITVDIKPAQIRVTDKIGHVMGDILEYGRVLNVVVGNPRQFDDGGRNGHRRIDAFFIHVPLTVRMNFDQGDFNNSVLLDPCAGGFQIENDKCFG